MTKNLTLKNDITGDEILVKKGSNLLDYRASENSLPNFGCCKGLCGLCLIKITANCDKLPPPTEKEKETIGGLKRSCFEYRLACQLIISADFSFKPVYT